MGFFDDFRNAQKNRRDAEEILDMYYDEDDGNDYRSTAIKNTSSNHGWYTCPRCGRKFRVSDMDADHIIPQSLGGDNSRYNLQLLCQHCNRSKQADMSHTSSDLRRRRKELNQQYDEDLEFVEHTLSQMRQKNKKNKEE